MNDIQYVLNIDRKLDKLNENFKKYLDVTTKGFFIFLLLYAFNNLDKIEKYKNSNFKAGAQFRSETDTSYNNYILILLTKYMKMNNKKMDEIYNGNINIKDVLNDLERYANAAGLYLIDNDLNMWKNNVNDKNAHEFIYDVLLILQDYNEEVPF